MRQVDAHLDAVNGVIDVLGATNLLGAEEKKAKRAEYVAEGGKLHEFMRRLSLLLERDTADGGFIAGDKLSIADFAYIAIARGFASGSMDHVPADFLDKNFPVITAFVNKVSEQPKVAEYLATLRK